MAKCWPVQVLVSRPDNAADPLPGCGKPNKTLIRINDQDKGLGARIRIKFSLSRLTLLSGSPG